jgi:predicted DNA-binding protein YlxM (UPF0122 family)
VDNILGKCNFNKRQEDIFSMYYIDDKPIGYIADILGYSKPSISKELFVIRIKIEKLTNKKD